MCEQPNNEKLAPPRLCLQIPTAQEPLASGVLSLPKLQTLGEESMRKQAFLVSYQLPGFIPSLNTRNPNGFLGLPGQHRIRHLIRG